METFDSFFVSYIITQNPGMSETWRVVLIAACILASAVIAYLLGSINTAILLSKIFYKEDIRQHGSGNAGMTNMLRTYGKGVAALTFAGDMLKCAIAMIIGWLLLGVDGMDIAGLFCVIGHVFPCWFKFVGGKGMAVTIMVMLMTNWQVALILMTIFLIIVLGTKYMSLASIMVSLMYPVLLSSWNEMGFIPIDKQHNVLFAVLITGIVVVMHRKNIKRLIDKTESKVSLGKKKKQTEQEAEAEITEAVSGDGKPMTASYRRQLNKKNKKGNKK